MPQLTKELEDCAQMCFECAMACGACEKACIMGGMGQMADCALACQDCLEACLAVVAILARQSDRYPAAMTYCTQICEACAEICDEFEDPQMSQCAQKCHECAAECNKLAGN